MKANNKQDSAMTRMMKCAAMASAIAILASTGSFAEDKAAGKDAPAKVEAAPDLAPGLAPGVVPGARAGGMEAEPLGASQHPAFAPSPVTPENNAAVDFSPSAVLGSPDWPCVQRKVPIISAGQIWDGPSIENIKDFDPAIRNLTDVLESRRVSTEEAEKAIKEYAASIPEAERDQKLTELFANFLHEINTDREFVMGKVEEFQRRQKARAAELEREGQQLAEKGLAATDELLPTETQLSPEQQEYNWNARIFQERQQNLTLACEVPVLIEQRAFEISRLIRAEMKS